MLIHWDWHLSQRNFPAEVDLANLTDLAWFMPNAFLVIAIGWFMGDLSGHCSSSLPIPITLDRSPL